MRDDEIESRLNHPDNLVNRLNRLTDKNSAGLFGIERSKPAGITSLPPSIDKLVDNLGSKLVKSRIEAGAEEVLNTAIEQLKYRIGDVDKPEKLSRIATDMSKIISEVHEGNQSRKYGTGNQQVIVYKPMVLSESSLQIVHVNE